MITNILIPVDGSECSDRAVTQAIEIAKANIEKYQIDCNFEEVDSYTFTNQESEISPAVSIFQEAVSEIRSFYS